MNAKRIEWIVTLRALAAAAVVLLHTVSGWLDPSGGGWEFLTGSRLVLDKFVLFILTHWAVPCFVMISGLLLLDPNKPLGLRKLFHYLLRMLAVLFTFGLFYCLLEAATTSGVSDPLGVLLTSLKNLCEGKSWNHMWYVYMLIGLYLLTPLLRIFVREADGRTACLTLAALFIFTILRPTLNALFKLELSKIIAVTAPYPFYYLAGYYIGKSRVSPKHCTVALVVGVVGIVGTLLLEMCGRIEAPSNANAFVALYSMAIFAAAKDARWLMRISVHPMIRAISKYSFGIYLTHTFFLNLLNKVFDIFPNVLPIGVGEFTFFIFVLAGSFALTWLLCRIGPLRRILL